MNKKLNISLGRPGQGPSVPANADDFIRAATPEPQLDPPPSPPTPAPASKPKPPKVEAVSDVTPPAPRTSRPKTPEPRIGPKGGTKTVLANGNQRITISLEPDLYKAVREKAFKEHIDLSELLRRAAREYLGLEKA